MHVVFKNKVLLANSVGDALNTSEFLFFLIFFFLKQTLKTDNLVLSNSALCLSLGSLSVAG